MVKNAGNCDKKCNKMPCVQEGNVHEALEALIRVQRRFVVRKMMTLIRVPYGKKSTPKHMREYQLFGSGPVGTMKEWQGMYPDKKFKFVERTMPKKKGLFESENLW